VRPTGESLPIVNPRNAPARPADVVMPPIDRVGFFRKRRMVAVGAAVISFLSMAVHELPATAVAVERDAFEGASQRLTTPSAAFGPIATREVFQITEYTPVQWPIAPRSDVSSGFGWRVAPCFWGCSSDHQGVDFDPGYGTSIHVIAEGVVIEAGSDGGLGQHVVVRHAINGQTVDSVYGHMIYGSQTVAVGQKVKLGQVIGRVGSTGASTGPHLHFEIRPGGGDAVEPLSWLARNVTEPFRG